MPTPEPGPGQVLIRLRAAGMNPMDRALASGAWKPMPATFPMVLGVDGAGVVEQLGPGASRFSVGDDLFGQLLIAPLGSAGTYAEYVAVTEDAPLARVPGGLDDVVAAALPTAGGAGLALVDLLEPLADKTVLIVGAGGGVGSFATQFAANAGARPTDSLGESLVLVGDLENRRAELEERFPPLANPRAGTTDRAAPCRDHRHCLPCRDSRRRTLEEPARPGRSPPRGGSRCALGGPMATGQNPSPTTPSKYSWTTDGAPQSSTPFSWICAAAFACAAVLAATFITGPGRPTPARRPALIQTPVPHLTCPVAFPSAPEQTRPDSSQASGRSFAAAAPSPSRPG
jgi:hypothetical protein